MNKFKGRVLKSINKGINVSIFGIEASGHNTLVEEILKSLGRCYISILDPRLFNEYNEDLVKHYLFLSLKGLNDWNYFRKIKSFDDFVYLPTKNKKLVILFKNTEVAIDKYPQIFRFLRGLSRMNRGSVVLIFTGNHHSLRRDTAKIEDAEIFLGNILINSPYNFEKSEDVFSSYSFVKKWLNRELKVKVLNLCGGNPNIVQGMARYLNSCKRKPVDLSSESFVNRSEVCVRLNQIYQSLNKNEISVLRNTLFGKKMKDIDENLELMRKIGLINSEGKIFSPLFAGYLLRKFVKKKSVINIENETLYINGKISNNFTKNEFVLFKLFLKNEGKILNRDTVFDEVWKKNYENYSDWSLDQLIRRLRLKLSRYNFADNLLTVKKRGFMWYFD